MLRLDKLENNIDHVSFDNLDKLNTTVSDEVGSELVKLFDIPNARVIIDLTGIKYIDSSGFGCFLSTMKAARNNYGKLKICNINPEVLTIFKSLQLHTVLDICDDVDSCIKSF